MYCVSAGFFYSYLSFLLYYNLPFTPFLPFLPSLLPLYHLTARHNALYTLFYNVKTYYLLL